MAMSWYLLETSVTPEHGGVTWPVSKCITVLIKQEEGMAPHRSLPVPGKVIGQLLDLAKYLQKVSRFISTARRSFLACENSEWERKGKTR